MTKLKLDEQWRNVIKTQIERAGDFDVSDFFDEWFHKHGTAYTIIFKKNLATTDMQYAELYALIRQYTSPVGSNLNNINNVMFHNTDDFKSVISEIFNSVKISHKDTDFKWEDFFEAFEALFIHGIILDANYGSCSIFIPPCLSLALSAVCAQSGYIDSCGRQIYVRKFEKATFAEFDTRIKAYLNRRQSANISEVWRKKIYLSSWDYGKRFKSNSATLDSSYSDIFALKIHQDKIRINNKKVTDIIKDLLEKYAEYLTEYDLVNNQATSETEDGVIWILQDKGIEYSGNKIYPTSKRLLICYHQFFKNANPMHFFDENKPAWNAPITIPHTLLASMVNITRPFNNANIIKIHDPFCGSGSLILEMLKDDHVFATGGDNSKIANFLLKHNLEFFSLTADDIRTLKNNFKTVAESIKNNSHEDAKKKYDVKALKNINYKEGFEKAHNLLIDLINFEKNPEKDPSSYTYSEDFEKRINNYSNLERLIFYVALRAHVKRCAIQTETWSDSFHDEALNLINSLEKFIYWKQLEFANSARPKIQSSSVNLGMTLNDAFGFLNLALNYRLYQTAFEEKYFEREQEADATEDNPEFDQYYDIVVTDPPYGFNTNENVYELSNLYANFIKVWIKKIKPKGHLVICLPSETYNGQVLPFCTMPELVTAQVLAAVAAENKIIISPAKMQPSLSPGMQPPYFWVSTKVLRRSILHFQIDTLN